MRKLTTEEQKALESLYKDENLQYKGLIRQFLIANTYEPKYKIGDYVTITDLNTRIYGNQAENIKCQITELHFWLQKKGDEKITYGAIALDQDGNDYFLCAEESVHGNYEERRITGRCEDNINHIEKKSKYRQSSNF